MYNNTDSVLVLFSDDSPLAEMQHLKKTYMSRQGNPEATAANNTASTEIPFSVVVADLAQSDAAQQERLLRLDRYDYFKDSAFVVLHNEEDLDALNPEIRKRATALLSHPVCENGLMKTIEECLSHFQQKISLQDNLKEIISAFKTMTQGSFSFKRLEEAKSLSMLLSSLCPDINEAAIGLLELMINGIEHGNLEISFEEKGTLVADGKWHEEVEHRLTLAKYSERTASVQFERTETKIEFVISDQGSGFNADMYLPGPDSDNANSPILCFHGRGIKLAAEVCFDRLEYLGNGNQVKATIIL